MKSTELREYLSDWLSSLGPRENLQTAPTSRGTGIIRSTFAIGPSEVLKHGEPLTQFYPVVIQWRYPGNTPYRDLPIGKIESVREYLVMTLPCSEDVDVKIGDTEITVYRTEDNSGWIISLGLFVVCSFYWEPEDSYADVLTSLTPSAPIEITEVDVEARTWTS